MLLGALRWSRSDLRRRYALPLTGGQHLSSDVRRFLAGSVASDQDLKTSAVAQRPCESRAAADVLSLLASAASGESGY